MAPSINTYVTSSGATAVKVVFKHRGRRTVQHIGSAHDEAELAVLMAKARMVARAGQQALDLDSLAGARASSTPGSALMGAARSELLVNVLEHAWNAVHLDAAVQGDEGFKQAARRPRFVKGARDSLSLDETALARARAAAGLKGYVTNMTAARMDAAEVVASYRSLWHVEQSWRMSKHDLRARPVFHHRRDSIEAHLTMVMAALAVARYLQDATGMSIKRIIHTLEPIRTAEIHLGGQTITASNPITPAAQHILDALDIKPDQ